MTEGGEDMWTEALTRAGKILHCMCLYQSPYHLDVCLAFILSKVDSLQYRNYCIVC